MMKFYTYYAYNRKNFFYISEYTKTNNSEISKILSWDCR